MEHWQLPEYVYANQTTLHPVGGIAIAILGAATLILPRGRALYPMLIMTCFISSAQRIVVAGLDFDLVRIMVLFGWLRIVLWGETRGFQWRPVDFLIFVYVAWNVIANALLLESWFGLINRLGHGFDAIGLYFMARVLIKNRDDLQRVINFFVWLSVPLAIFFTYEHFTRHNIFSAFGGVPATTVERGGRLRCQGAFAHPILAGVFWASLLPLMASCWWEANGKGYFRAILGVTCGLIIVVMCSSSTPVMGVIFAGVGAAFFFLRLRMRMIRWFCLFALVFLHFTMNQPVWHLLARVDIVGGSTGYHRYALVNAWVERFSDWALVGTETTADWGYRLADATNQYVVESVQGGLFGLLVYLCMIALCFQGVGRAWKMAWPDRHAIVLFWCLGISLWVHCTAFIAVSYFGQIKVIWYFTLGMIMSMTPSPSAYWAAVDAHRPLPDAPRYPEREPQPLPSGHAATSNPGG